MQIYKNIQNYKYKCSNMQIQINHFKYESAMKCKVAPKFVKGSNVVAATQMELDGTHVQTPSTRTTTNSWSNIQKS